MKYRPEIDGLRALAVVPVILFHAGLGPFYGGFIGVDIFFVISGYLITSILLREMDRGDFSLLRFYERRARRILPALFLVLAASLPFAWFWMFPDQYRSFAYSVVATTTFVSNIFFWSGTGYFDGAAELKPLLHTWSLAVEEQFYLFFPALLLMAWRWPRQRVFQLVVILALASFALSEWGWRNAPNANFYLAPARVWELFSGAICAFLLDRREQAGKDMLGLTGLVMILAGIFLFDKHTPFPSAYALLPVMGTCMVILWGSSGTLTARLLSLSPFVGIGMISYSAYLWHQPVFAFARLREELVPTELHMAFLSLLTIGLSYLSWRFVEQPARKRGTGVLPNQARVFAFAGVGTAALICIGLLGATTIPPRIAIPSLQPAEMSAGPAPFSPLPPVPKIRSGTPCEDFAYDRKGFECTVFGNGPLKTVLWGDSHGMTFQPVIEPLDGETIYLVVHTGCPPLAGAVLEKRFGGNEHCAVPENSRALASAIKALDPDRVLLIGRWMVYLNGWRRYGELLNETHLLEGGPPGDDPVAASRGLFEESLAETIKLFAEHSSVFVATQPADLAYLTRDGRYYTKRGMFFIKSLAKADVDNLHDAEQEILGRVAQDQPARIIDSRALLCPEGTCLFWNGRTRLYSDDNHLGDEGAAFMWQYYLDQLRL